MIQSVSFTSAAFEAFAEAYLCFLVSASAKKNAEVIKFLGILKKYVSENKINFCSEKEGNISLNKLTGNSGNLLKLFQIISVTGSKD